MEAWSTEDEIEYLNNIGTFSKTCNNKSTLKMLEHYMRAFPHRKNWNHLDRKVLQIYVARKLRAARKNGE